MRAMKALWPLLAVRAANIDTVMRRMEVTSSGELQKHLEDISFSYFNSFKFVEIHLKHVL